MKQELCRSLESEELFSKLRKLEPIKAIQKPKRASQSVGDVKTKLMLIRLNKSHKDSSEELLDVETLCHFLQQDSDNWSCEGIFSVKEGFKPYFQLGTNAPSFWRKDETCVVMSSTEPIYTYFLRDGLMSMCSEPEEHRLVANCQICTLSKKQEKSFDSLLSSCSIDFVLFAAEESLRSNAEIKSDRDAMKSLFEIIMEEDAGCRYYFYKFFENAGYPALAIRLICSAADDNYKPAVQFLGGYEKFVEEESLRNLISHESPTSSLG